MLTQKRPVLLLLLPLPPPTPRALLAAAFALSIFFLPLAFALSSLATSRTILSPFFFLLPGPSSRALPVNAIMNPNNRQVSLSRNHPSA